MAPALAPSAASQLPPSPTDTLVSQLFQTMVSAIFFHDKFDAFMHEHMQQRAEELQEHLLITIPLATMHRRDFQPHSQC